MYADWNDARACRICDEANDVVEAAVQLARAGMYAWAADVEGDLDDKQRATVYAQLDPEQLQQLAFACMRNHFEGLRGVDLRKLPPDERVRHEEALRECFRVMGDAKAGRFP